MKNVVLVLCVLISLNSCKKEDNSKLASTKLTSDYLPMRIGNYWIYQQFENDSSARMIQSKCSDSIIISKDTLIKGVQYFRYDRYVFMSLSENLPQIVTNYYRDSAKNLIDPNGKIVFSENNFTDQIYKATYTSNADTIYWTTGKMEKVNNNIVVPCGDFDNILNLRCTVICNPKFTGIKNPRYNDYYYAKDIGMILYSRFWFNSGDNMELRLARYKIIR